MTHRPAPRGFTLLEVVLAITLALVVMAAMLTFLRQSAQIREAVLAEARLIGGERLVMDRVTDELRASLLNSFIGLGLEGGLDQVRFATTALPGPSAWVVARATDTQRAAPERDVQIVGYRLRYAEDEMGQPYVAGLERTCQKNPTAQVSEEGQEIEVVLLSEEIRFLRLRYWDGSTWVESWGGGDLPGAVELVLGEYPLLEGEDPLTYPYPTFRRVVFVPAGVKSTGGTIIRGLEGAGEGGT